MASAAIIVKIHYVGVLSVSTMLVLNLFLCRLLYDIKVTNCIILCLRIV